MKRIICISFLLAGLSAALPLAGQTVIASPSQSFVEDCVRDAVIMVEQQYQLLDTVANKRYGRQSNEHFGKTISFGVLVKNGYCLSDESVAPWKYDAHFKKYDGIYKGVVSKSTAFSLKSKQLVTMPATESYLQICKDNSFAFVRDRKSFNAEGLDVSASSDISDGWIVWVYGETLVESIDTVSDISVIAFKKYFDTKSDNIQVMTPFKDKCIYGAFILTPATKQVGILSLRLSGFAVKGDSGKWNVVFLKPGFDIGDDDKSIVENGQSANKTAEEDDELTEIPGSNDLLSKLKIRKKNK